MGGLVPIAQAQSLTPLRVDPTLLGLPPIKPAEAPAPDPYKERGLIFL